MDIKSQIAPSGYTIVKFHASWCAPCKMLNPILEKISTRDDVTLISVDADQHPDVTKEYEVTGLPTMLFYKDGEFRSTEVGLMNEATITKHLESL